MYDSITVNADLGESVGIHSFGNDEALVGIVDTINVACGMHAGDPTAMDRTVRLAAAAGVTVGAHPGLPDIAGFGRRAMAITPAEARDLIRYQVAALVGFLDAHGLPLDHIKPHGALFGMTSRDESLMMGVCDVAAQYDVPVFGIAGTAHETAARAAGVHFVSEFYVDLDYDADGTLIVERIPPSRQAAEIRRRARQAIVEGTLTARDGTVLSVDVQSVCIHSDTAEAVTSAGVVREVLAEARRTER
jgi:UPF0271 protein